MMSKSDIPKQEQLVWHFEHVAVTRQREAAQFRSDGTAGPWEQEARAEAYLYARDAYSRLDNERNLLKAMCDIFNYIPHS